MRLALYQPEIPQNTGTLLRLSACLGVEICLIEPCGFLLSDRLLKRAGLDYLEFSQLIRYKNWEDFYKKSQKRSILLTSKAKTSFLDFQFEPDDTLIFGQESKGLPQSILTQIPAHLKIPMLPERRSLNLAVSASIVLAEALRQTNLFPQGG